ncbi:MAG: phosphoserine phosphatase SerB [Acidimicrobiales bacterium]
MDGAPSALVTVSGRDRPGVAARVFARLGDAGLHLVDAEQVQVHGRLLLCMEVEGPLATGDELRRSLAGTLEDAGDDLTVTVVPLGGRSSEGARPDTARQLVTVLAPDLGPSAMGAVCGRIAACGGNIDRIVRLSTYPVTSYELVVSGGDPARLRQELGAEASRLRVDVAVQRAGLHRRAKHLIVLDADSTLLQGEVIDLLAERAGCADRVAAVTAAAMAGDIDFTESLTQRLRLLAGTEESVLEALATSLELAPGARTLVRTLHRLGYVTAVVSGGFVQVIKPIAAGLGIDLVAANTLEVAEGRLTGRLVGPVVDRAGKAAALAHFAEVAGVPLSRTIAVGDGANDLDMLAVAGLGIAFNAKPVVRGAADTALNVPYLDAILFLLGISRQEIERADEEGDDAVPGFVPDPVRAVGRPA